MMLKTSLLLAALTITTLVQVAPASADFRYTGPTERDISEVKIFERFTLPGATFRADNAPLKVVLQMIAGKDVFIELGADIDPDMPVSFRGGRPRRDILNEILLGRDMAWRFRAGKLTVRTKRELALARNAGGVSREDEFARPMVWKIPKDVYLERLFIEWCARANITLDYRVNRPVQLGASHEVEGTILQAIDQVIDEGLGDSIDIATRFNTRNNLLEVWELGAEE